MFRVGLAALAAGFLLAGQAGQASATIMQATVTGTAAAPGSQDYTGVFGSPGPIAAGTPWSAVFTYDTSRGEIQTIGSTPGGGFILTGGDSDPGFTTPVLDATFTLGGISRSITGQFIGGIVLWPSYGAEHGEPGVHYVEFAAVQSFGSPLAGIFDAKIYTTDAVPVDLATPFSISGVNRVTNSSGFARYAYDAADNVIDGFQVDPVGDLFVTVRVLSPVPEPAAWALLLVGFAGVGGALRRARKRAFSISGVS